VKVRPASKSWFWAYAFVEVLGILFFLKVAMMPMPWWAIGVVTALQALCAANFVAMYLWTFCERRLPFPLTQRLILVDCSEGPITIQKIDPSPHQVIIGGVNFPTTPPEPEHPARRPRGHR
jgi:hypothetical protein